MLRQNALLRRHALGSFEQLALDVTRDPAMLLWLNGTSNNQAGDVNENYARELQELFCLGAGRGYSERDVRELARALTGFRNDWSDGRGPHASATTASSTTRGFKRIYGKRGRFGWRDGVRLVVAPPPAPVVHGRASCGATSSRRRRRAATARALERMYVAHGRDVRPLLDAILRHPHLYDPDRRMVKPPVVQAAGMLRAVGRGIDTDAWAWLCDQAGQMLFEPPNVSGWDDTRWLDTATFRARWQMASEICNHGAARRRRRNRRPGRARRSSSRRAAALLGRTPLSRPTRDGARALRRATRWRPPTSRWERDVLPRPDRERAAHARRRLPRLPDL